MYKKTVQQTMSRGSSVLGAVLVIGLVIVIYPFAQMFSAFYQIGKAAEKNHYSFDKTYPEIDYNDSRIDYYKAELEYSSIKFIQTENEVDIFRYITEKDIATDCIDYYLKKHNKSSKYNEALNIKINIRNKLANTEELIELTKNNMYLFNTNNYTYNYDIFSKIIENLTNSRHLKSAQSICDKNISVAEVYDNYKDNYIREYIKQHLQNKKEPPVISEKYKQEAISKEEKWIEQFTGKSYKEALKFYR